MATKKRYGGIGSVSSGTLDTQELIDRFLYETNNLILSKEERKNVDAIKKKTEREEYDFTSSEATEFLELLFEILDAHSLPYFSFSTHPDDGADFGWWLPNKELDGFDGITVTDTGEVPKGYTGEVLVINDHGNMTLYSASRGRLKEIWAVV